MKPYKGQCIVLVNRVDCYNFKEKLFIDTSRFQLLDNHPTLQNLSTVQSYFSKLYNRPEITLEGKNAIRLIFAQVEQAPILPKILKNYYHFPTIHPIIDTTNTAHYGIVKFSSSLFNPLTENEFIIKNSFKAAYRIQITPTELFDIGYKFTSFGIMSLLTNVPLNRTLIMKETNYGLLYKNSIQFHQQNLKTDG